MTDDEEFEPPDMPMMARRIATLRCMSLERFTKLQAAEAEVARLREDNQRLKGAFTAMEEQLHVVRYQAVEALNEAEELHAERDRLAGVIEQIRALCDDADERAGNGLSLLSTDHVLALLPAPTDGTNTTDDTPETT